MDDNVKESLTRGETWMRGLFMVLIGIFYSIAEFLIFFAAFFNFVWLLFTRETHDRIRDFSDDLTVYAYQALQYISFNTEDMPFPWGPWPDEMDPEPMVDDPDSLDPMQVDDAVADAAHDVDNTPDGDETRSDVNTGPDDTTGDDPEPPRLLHG